MVVEFGKFKAIFARSIKISVQSCAVLLLVVLIPIKPIFAQSKKYLLESGQLAQLNAGETACSCGYVLEKWQSGVISKNLSTFYRHQDKISITKRKFRVKSGKALLKLKKLYKKLRKDKGMCTPLCADLPPPSNQGGDPDDSQNPEPVPTAVVPSPTATVGCYNSQGDTSCFGIPQGVVGNIARGEFNWIGIGCQGCHTGSADGGRRNRRFSDYAAAFQNIPEMQPFSDSCDTQCLADVTSYLNRYNLNQ